MENQYELDREVAQGHGNDHVRLSKAKAIPEISQNTPKHCGAVAERSKEEIVATDEAAGIADERSSSTACMHTMLRKNEQLSHPLVTAAPVSMQANSPAPVATAQVTKAKQTVTHLQTDQGTVLGTSNTVIVEKREMRRRHTVDSGWHDRELEEIAQTTSSFRHDDSTRLEGVADKLSEDEVVMPDSMMAAETPSSASDQLSNARHPAAASQQAQKLRLRRKGPFDRKTYQRMETERKAAYPDGGPGASGMLSKTIILLFYALFGIVVLAFTTAGTAASSWWKPNPQSRHNTDAHRDTSTIADQMLKDHDATDLDDDDS
ncbi:hypothetical protein PWT90_00105 [Aphanocladium album]|nr:hypothetical protein PWT90_00105 [Aphanocladium album]